MGLSELSRKVASFSQYLSGKLPLGGTELLLLPALLIYIKWEDWSTLGDTGYYTQSGYEILTGGNPYLGDAKWGSFSAVAMYLLFGWYPKFLASLILVGANFLGVYAFAKMQDLSRESALKISLIVAITSINRENLVNGQITGIILLSIAISQRLFINQKYVLLASALTVFALEMKPQVAIPLIIFLWKGFDIPWRKILGFGVVAHGLIIIINGNFLDKDFLSQILKSSTSNPKRVWENTHNLLPILDILINNSSYTKIIGIIVVLGSLLFTIKKFSIRALLLTSLFMPYIHLYDLLGLAIICFAKLFKNRTISPSLLIAFLIILSPLRNLSIENLLLGSLILYVIISSKTVKFSRENKYQVILLTLFLPNFFPALRPDTPVLLNSWITTSVVIALMILVSKPVQSRNPQVASSESKEKPNEYF